MNVLLIAIAVISIATPAAAEPISLAIGNFVFSSLYTIGVPGALANIVANAIVPLALTSASNGPAAMVEKDARP